jgi:hypothetical protein
MFYGASSPSNNNFWCAIFEKAIVKLYGDSYEKISSNANFEIYHLSGWYFKKKN